MPGEEALLGAVASGASGLSSMYGQVFNLGSQMLMNRRQRRWMENMYYKQREHGLADWAMQNEYNSPSAQMRRLKAAGLNPNLVYGHGADAGSVGSVRGSSVGSWNPSVPALTMPDVRSALSAYYDVQVKEAQIDNLKTQNTVMQQDALLKSAQVVGTGLSSEQKKIDLQYQDQLKQISVEAAKASVQRTLSGTTVMLDENERRAAMQAPNLLIAAERVLNMRSDRATNVVQRAHLRQQVEVLRKDEQLKQLDIDLKRMGVQPTDALWQRVLARVLEKAFPNGLDLNYNLRDAVNDKIRSGGSKYAPPMPWKQLWRPGY